MHENDSDGDDIHICKVPIFKINFNSRIGIIVSGQRLKWQNSKTACWSSEIIGLNAHNNHQEMVNVQLTEYDHAKSSKTSYWFQCT